ncbi:manirer-2 protein [Nephila pilipes]|uniref:Manirer-2 protein n=1 Tax=Nephila pilipes TaxID=299642 RepID=A0A8X6PTE6_NEPPI|nr:manirer-2 protein [Nephila pilipes]
MEISEIHVLMKYEFISGATTRQAVTNINSVFIIQVATNATVDRWFKKFRSGDFDLSNEPRGRPKTQVDNDVLKTTVKANFCQNAHEPPKHCPKRDIHQKKLMVTVGGVAQMSSTIALWNLANRSCYCYRLDEMMRNLAIKQPNG